MAKKNSDTRKVFLVVHPEWQGSNVHLFTEAPTVSKVSEVQVGRCCFERACPGNKVENISFSVEPMGDGVCGTYELLGKSLPQGTYEVEIKKVK